MSYFDLYHNVVSTVALNGQTALPSTFQKYVKKLPSARNQKRDDIFILCSVATVVYCSVLCTVE